MVFRQVFFGISGGALLAALALLLTVPRSFFEERGPLWLRGVLFSSSLSVAATPEGLQNHKETFSEELEPAAPEGTLVASLAEVGAPAAHDMNKEGPSKHEELEPELEPSAEDLVPDLYVGALSKQTIIRSRPDLGASIIGFARTGSLLRRAAVPVSRKGCKEGWYRVEPDGYICVGQTATIDPTHPIVRLASLAPR